MKTDCRFNLKEDGKTLSVEIKCCGSHIGEMRFNEGESRSCPICNTTYSLRMGYNHFHLSVEPKDKE